VDHEGVSPDIMAVAKSLGGGVMPIGAALCRRDLWMRAYGTLDACTLQSSTFGGGSLACAAGLAALRAIEDDGLIGRAKDRGVELLAGLRQLCRPGGIVAGVRGRGLLLGVEFRPLPEAVAAHWIQGTGPSVNLIPRAGELIASMPSVYVMQAMLGKHGVYTQVSRSNPLVLRVQPPLTVTAEHVEYFLGALRESCREIEFFGSTFNSAIAKSLIGKVEPRR
jgi:putrescine aminotransferase